MDLPDWVNLPDWLYYELLGNPVLTWATSIGVFVAAWIVLGVVHRVIRRRVAVLAERRKGTALQIAEHVIGQTRAWLILLIALFVASRLLVWPPAAQLIITRIVVIGLLLQIGLWATAALGAFLKSKRQLQLTRDPGTVAAMDVMGFVLRLAVWSLVILMAIANLGVDVTAMIAGLGIGGIAVALAAQNILGDLFASLSIVLDKPFVVGDFLAVQDFLGSVEYVGLKSTRLRSLSGEQIVFSNNDLLNSRVRNFGRMFERRALFTVEVTYKTSPDKLRLIPTIIREALEGQDKVRFDRAHFQKYGPFSLIFEVVYYVTSADYNVYMDIQQNVNLILLERFAEEGIEFAYPTQTIYLVQAEPAAAAGTAEVHRAEVTKGANS